MSGGGVEQSGDYTVVYVTTAFGTQTLDTKVVYDAAGKVAGLFFVPTAGAASTSYEPPAYVTADAFAEQEVTVGTGAWALPGTLSLPTGTGPFPAVVLVHGSGPQDRDETIGPNKPFRDLAGGLASRGVAVLRYDKRTKVYAERMAGSADTITTKEETIDDAVSAVRLLRERPDVDPNRIFVLGHSLGGTLAPRIGSASADVAGLILLAGAARPLEDVILEQTTYLLGLQSGLSDAERTAQIDEVRAQVAKVKDPALSVDTPVGELPLGIPAAYWLDLRGYDPAAAAATLATPVLVLQGGRDYQVTTADYHLWQAALLGRPGAAFKLYPDLNHLFVTGSGKSTPAEYEIAGHVAPPVVADIATWIDAHR
jgi:dienelactone hydrolase